MIRESGLLFWATLYIGAVKLHLRFSSGT